MNNTFHPENLDNILDAYISAVQRPNRESLIEWVRKYPQYERELTEFTVAWIQMEVFPPKKREEPDNNILVLRGMSIVQNLLHESRNRSNTKQVANPPIKELVDEGKSNGYTPETFASLLKLSVPLFWKLDRRLILYSSIPIDLIDKVTVLIHRGLLEVADYFQRPPMLPARAHYKADRQPRLAEPRDFFDEVREDRELSDEYRNYWIEVEPRNY